MKLVENTKASIFEKYENILDIITNLKDPSVSNIHSVDIIKTRDKLPNIAFDYDKDIAVMINISEDSIQIIAPDDVYNKLKSLIVSNYPDYRNIIIR